MAETIVTKHCPKCNTTKPITEFGPNRSRTSGIQDYCRLCMNEIRAVYKKSPKGRASEKRYKQGEAGRKARYRYHRGHAGQASMYRNNHSEAGKARRKRYHQTGGGKGRTQKYREQDRERDLAHRAVSYATSRGLIPPARELPCFSVCGNMADIYHHPNGYDEEHALDVVPICHKCHKRIHTTSPTSPDSQPSGQSNVPASPLAVTR